MSRAFEIDLLARGVSDGWLLASLRSRQTQETIDDCLAVWDDSRADYHYQRFTVPQSVTFSGIIAGLGVMEQALRRFGQDAGRCEDGAREIRMGSRDLESVWRACHNACDTSNHLAADARGNATAALAIAKDVTAAVTSLGHPPV